MTVPLKTWIESSKPHMAGIWISSAIVPAAAAWVDGVFDLAIFVLEALLCWLMLTLVCFADEYGDFEKGVDNEHRLGPITPTQRGEIDKRSMKRALAVLGVEVALVGAALLAWSCLRALPDPQRTFEALAAADVNTLTELALAADAPALLGFLAFGVVCIAAAYLYTIGDRAYGYVGLGDLAGFLFFGLVAGVGGYWLYGHTMDWAIIFPSAATGLMLAASINLNNIRDIDNDTEHGKVTLAVRLGRKRAQAYHYALLTAACLLYLAFPVAHGMTHVLYYLFVIAYLPVAKHAVDFCRIMHRGSLADLKPLMKPLVRAELILTMAFAICISLPF